MEREQVQPARLIDLGPATEQTLGAEGKITDFVAMMDHWGISDD